MTQIILFHWLHFVCDHYFMLLMIQILVCPEFAAISELMLKVKVTAIFSRKDAHCGHFLCTFKVTILYWISLLNIRQGTCPAWTETVSMLWNRQWTFIADSLGRGAKDTKSRTKTELCWSWMWKWIACLHS